MRSVLRVASSCDVDVSGEERNNRLMDLLIYILLLLYSLWALKLCSIMTGTIAFRIVFT